MNKIQHKAITKFHKCNGRLGWHKLTVMLLLFLLGCDINPEFKKTIIGVWEGNKGARHWCIELTDEGQITMAHVFVGSDGKPMKVNLSLGKVQHFSGTWLLGNGKRFITQLAPIERNTTNNKKVPKVSKSTYFIKKLDTNTFIYTDISYKNAFENIRVEACSDKFDLPASN